MESGSVVRKAKKKLSGLKRAVGDIPGGSPSSGRKEAKTQETARALRPVKSTVQTKKENLNKTRSARPKTGRESQTPRTGLTATGKRGGNKEAAFSSVTSALGRRAGELQSRVSAGKEGRGYREKLAEQLATDAGQKKLKTALADKGAGGQKAVSFSGRPVDRGSAADIPGKVKRGEMAGMPDGSFRYARLGKAVRQDTEDSSRTRDAAEKNIRFLWPVEGGRISSHFGPRKSFRTKNGAWSSSNHPSIDIAAPDGTPIRSVATGKVTFAGVKSGYGYTVEVTHTDGSVAKYHHMNAPTSLQVGDVVAQGETVGAVGETGNATGPHLDITLVVDGKTVDPERYLGKATVSGVTSGKPGTRTAAVDATYRAYQERERAAGRVPIYISGMSGEGTPSDRLLAMVNQEAGEAPLVPVVKTVSAKTPTASKPQTTSKSVPYTAAAAPSSGGNQKKETATFVLSPTLRLTREEYEMRRSSDPKLPEFSRYAYFQNEEAALGKYMDIIAKDADWQDSIYRAWARSYETSPALQKNPAIREIYQKFRRYRQVIDAYKKVSDQMERMEGIGVHMKDNGELDVASGMKNAINRAKRGARLQAAEVPSDDDFTGARGGTADPNVQEEYDQWQKR